MRLVRYAYRHPTIGVQEIVLAQDGSSDDPTGIEAVFEAGRNPGAWHLDDEATRIVHPILRRTVIGNVVWVGTE